MDLDKAEDRTVPELIAKVREQEHALIQARGVMVTFPFHLYQDDTMRAYWSARFAVSKALGGVAGSS